MKDRKHGIRNSKLVNRLLFIAGLGVFVLFFFALTKELVNRRELDSRMNDYKTKIAQLKIENETLNSKIASWDKSGELEMNARIKLGLEKPGEQTVVINRKNSSGDAPVVKSNQEVINFDVDKLDGSYEPNPVKWWKYFF